MYWKITDANYISMKTEQTSKKLLGRKNLSDVDNEDLENIGVEKKNLLKKERVEQPCGTLVSAFTGIQRLLFHLWGCIN